MLFPDDCFNVTTIRFALQFVRAYADFANYEDWLLTPVLSGGLSWLLRLLKIAKGKASAYILRNQIRNNRFGVKVRNF